ncbi:ABC transporter permease [Sporolactobacillus laevolacticus]|uniref:Peptide ABC transporter permease n=1 Tax=Sporolactobacillus laevolacticus DSM 442 TaxID=1395513 RepID=V6J296_9BACL|nr:ABC transporter permease [Sporolactobacillus laevolacticus]EST10879.1 peptide ABC transporter permease [Sporolactobacillus laevolacticus DSM 442]
MEALIQKKSQKRTHTFVFWKHKLAFASVILLIIFVVTALFGNMISPYAPNTITGSFSAPPSVQHWLGTDQIGRDVLSRLIYGIKISLLVGVSVTVISSIIGIVIGLVAGFFGGKIDAALMGLTDMVMSFPYILLVLVAAAIFKPGLLSIILILGFVDWPGIARLVRGSVLSLRETNFIKADQLAGLPKTYILFSEILPNAIAPILIYATSVMAYSILDEAALSFLGMGIQPPTASLGNMLNGAENLTILTERLWLWLPPGIVIILLVLAINFIGDALRDSFDPNNHYK